MNSETPTSDKDYQAKLKQMTTELAVFIEDLNKLLAVKKELSSLLVIWKPICSAFIQFQRLLDENDKLALILTARYLYEQSVQCLWLLKSPNIGELERRHTMILKRAIASRLDYLDRKNELESIKTETTTPDFIKLLCQDLTKNLVQTTSEKQENEKAKEALTENLKKQNLAPANEAPNLDKMAEEALPCETQEHNRSLHFNLYKILSITSHPAVPFASQNEHGDFFKDYEGGTAIQVGKILAIKLVQYACNYTNHFIKNNTQ